MNSLGIYFGSKLIAISETKGKKLVNNTQVLQAVAPAGELEEKVPMEAKMVELVALFKDELRRGNIDSKRASICLSGKDLIIRNFEMPVLPRQELHAAVNFEAKKYIPFKVEEMVSDFQVQLDKINNKNLILFMGIKRDVLDRYIAIMNELNIKVDAIEYSAFSALRALKLANVNLKGINGVLWGDLKSEEEVNFIVLEDGFPLFSRDIFLTGGPGAEATEGAAEESSGMALEKLKTEIRVSLDYYHRKFPSKDIKNLFFMSNPENRSAIESFLSELGLSAKLLDVNKFIGQSVPYSLNFIKGYCVSLFKAIKLDISINLLTAQKKAHAAGERGLKLDKSQISDLIRGMKIDFRVVVLGILICAAIFGFGYYRITPLSTNINEIMGNRIKVSSIDEKAKYEDLVSISTKTKNKLGAIGDLVNKQTYLTQVLEAIAGASSSGIQLTDLVFNKKDDGSSDLIITGMVYLGDADSEFGAANQFISNLKRDPEFSKYFNTINIASLNQGMLDKRNVTNFRIECKGNR
ncbi:MAG: pilus assembly protein PilM [Candidatus Omnitrophica bacterium]|nr:pilus assembly protein PilM [Candidatus Omnitrophota bacterium]MBU1870061.1 pilus assembly protein PilM [Candidatus Omnitrophota bacterium]